MEERLFWMSLWPGRTVASIVFGVKIDGAVMGGTSIAVIAPKWLSSNQRIRNLDSGFQSILMFESAGFRVTTMSVLTDLPSS